MDQNILDDDFRENGVNVDIPLRNKNNEGEKSSYGSALKAHLKIHRGEKSNKFSLSSSWSFGL